MENASDQTTGKSSTSGYQARLKRKMARLQLGYSAWETHTFKRFYKIPLILSNILFFTVWSGITWAVVFAVDPQSFWPAMATGLVGAPALLVALAAKGISNTIMIRKRLWLFGKSKFSSWEEFAEWIKKTDAEELEFLAGEPDDAWIPALKTGGGLSNEDWDKE